MLANRSIPRCIVIPELAYPDIGKAIDWLGDAFGFTLRLRIADHRAQLNVGDGAVVLTELAEGRRVDVGHSVMVRVENVDRHCEQASRHGAKIIRGRPTIPSASANTASRISPDGAGPFRSPSLTSIPQHGAVSSASCRPSAPSGNSLQLP